MASSGDNGKVVVNLATGMEDPERVTVEIGQVVVERIESKGKQVAVWLTKDAVRLALPDHATGEACAGCPPLERLVGQYADGGGELLVCPICFNARSLDESQLAANAKIAGASPLHDWIGEGATVFSY